MVSPALRRAVGAWLTLFFLAVAGAPHQHVNGLEDLLLDEPSDSGTLFEIDNSSDVDEGTSVAAFEVIQDHPCLACFNRDFVSAPVSTIAFRFRLAPAVVPQPLSDGSDRRTRPRSVFSRGPRSLLDPVRMGHQARRRVSPTRRSDGAGNDEAEACLNAPRLRPVAI